MSEIAWPTIFLFSLANILGVGSYFLGSGFFLPIVAYHFSVEDSALKIMGSIGLTMICFLSSVICCYAQFTVTHDAIHRSISKNRGLNDWVGWIAHWWLGLTNNWMAIRNVHLAHHAHVNDPKKDPDYWCSLKGPGGKYLTPLRWLTVDATYLIHYIPRSLKKNWKHQIKFWMFEIIKYTLVALAFYWGWGWSLFFYWILPSRVSLLILAYAFDFLPHYPHEVTRKENKYQTTAYLYTPKLFQPLLKYLIFYQNYHLAHHLKPWVPFYLYGNAWEEMRGEILSEEIIVRHIFPEFIEKRLMQFQKALSEVHPIVAQVLEEPILFDEKKIGAHVE